MVVIDSRLATKMKFATTKATKDTKDEGFLSKDFQFFQMPQF